MFGVRLTLFCIYFVLGCLPMLATLIVAQAGRLYSKKLYDRFEGLVVYFTVLHTVMSYCLFAKAPLRVVITGQNMNPKEKYLILCNHLTYFDWLPLALYSLHTGCWNFRALGRHDLAYFPIFGWVCIAI